MIRTLRIRVLLAGLAVATACAPTERTTDPTPSEQEFHAGSLSGATIGRVGPAQTTNSGAVTLTGLVGNFTRLSVHESSGGQGDDALIYFAAGDTTGTSRIWRISTAGTGLRQLTSDTFGDVFPAVSNSGEQVVFARTGPFVDRETSITDLWLWTPSEGAHLLANERNLLSNPVWIPGDTSIIYPSFFHTGETNRGLYRRNTISAAVDSLTHAPDGLATISTQNGTTSAIFERGDALFRIDLTTLATAPYFDSDFRLFGPQVSPDGNRILFWRDETDVARVLLMAPLDHPEAARPITSVGPFVLFQPDARWLPDGSGVVILEDDSTVVPQLFSMDTLGTSQKQLTSMPFGVHGYFSIGRFAATPPRPLLGGDGVLGTMASGIIFGQGAGGSITAVVAFSSAKPRSITLKAETGLNANAPVLTYTLTADQLNSLRFISDPVNGEPVSVVDSSTSAAGGAVITFNAQTGAVALILPFATANSSSPMPAIVDQDGVRVFQGRFLGVWKGGKNVAPGGAGTVEFAWRSGSLQSR